MLEYWHGHWCDLVFCAKSYHSDCRCNWLCVAPIVASQTIAARLSGRVLAGHTQSALSFLIIMFMAITLSAALNEIQSKPMTRHLDIDAVHSLHRSHIASLVFLLDLMLWRFLKWLVSKWVFISILSHCSPNLYTYHNKGEAQKVNAQVGSPLGLEFWQAGVELKKDH